MKININRNYVNVAIIVALAVALDAIKGGQTVADVVKQIISLAFLTVIAWIGSRMYREHRITLYSLGTQRRTIVYVAAGVAALVLTASSKMFETAAGTVAWLALLIAAVYVIYAVYRSANEY